MKIIKITILAIVAVAMNMTAQGERYQSVATSNKVKYENKTYTVRLGKITNNNQRGVTVEILTDEKIEIPIRNGAYVTPITAHIEAGGRTFVTNDDALIADYSMLFSFDVMPEKVIVYGNDGYVNGPTVTLYVADSRGTRQQHQPVAVQPRQVNPVNTSAYNAWSQEKAPATQPRIGIKGGFNIADVTDVKNSDSSNEEYRTGLHLGVFLEHPLSDKVDIQPELVYSMQGGASDNVIVKLDYINIPFIFKIYVNKSRTFSIDVGPQIGYMLSAKGAYKGSTVDLSDYYDFNKIDGAVCVGVSYKFNPNFHFNFRANVSMTKTVDGYDDTNLVGQLGVGYMF